MTNTNAKVAGTQPATRGPLPLSFHVPGFRQVSVYRNTSDRTWWRAQLPVRQTLIWCGPLFVRVAPKLEGK